MKAIAWVMTRLMGAAGAETLSAAANIFLGQTEAPLIVKPFLNTMTQSELFNVMMSRHRPRRGGVMAAYICMRRRGCPSHLLRRDAHDRARQPSSWPR